MPPGAAYTVQSVLGGENMEESQTQEWDIDDFVFFGEEAGESQR